MQKRRTLGLLAAAVAAMVALTACGSDGDSGDSGNDGPTIVLGSANFTESELIARIYAHALEDAGFNTEVKAQIGSREVYIKSLQNDEIQVVPEYVGTVTEFFNAQINGKDAPTTAPLATADGYATFQALNRLIHSEGLIASTPSMAADQNAFAVTKDFAAKNNLVNVSDLAKLNGTLVLGGPPECPTRPFCQPGLEKTYGLKFKEFKQTDGGGPVTTGALTDGTIQVGLVFSSDGAVPANDLVILVDDKKLQQADNIIALMRSSVPADAQKVLDAVNAALTTEDLQEMNKKISVDKEEPEDMAKEWVEENLA